MFKNQDLFEPLRCKLPQHSGHSCWMSVRLLKLLLKNVGELRWNIYYYLFSSFPVCSCWFMSFIEMGFVSCNVLDVIKPPTGLFPPH